MTRYLKQNLLFCAVFAASFLGLLSAGHVSAATFRVGSDYTLESNTSVQDNLYTAGRTVVIGGEVQKDIAAAGASVVVQGPVGEDAMLAGGTVDVRGPVGGDVRTAGGELYIDGQVGGDLIAAGGTVHVRSSSRIEGDAVIFGDRVILDGTFAHGVTVRARSVEVRGTVQGPFDAAVGESLAIYDTAHLNNGITYSARNQGMISEKATIQGTTTFNRRTDEAEKGVRGVFMSVFGLFGFISFLSVVASTALLAYFFPHFCKQVVDRVLVDNKKAIATGFVVSIAFPIAVLLLLITVIGFVLGIFFGLCFLLLLALGKMLAGVLAGALLAQWRTKEVKVSWDWALWGAIALYFIGLIPFIGWFVVILFFFTVAGALSIMIYESWWKGRR